MEAYDPATVFSSIDRTGRYAYANQPLILGWNLARLAEALLPFFDANEDRAVDLANARLEAIAPAYHAAWVDVMRTKLALDGAEAGDAALAEDFLAAIQGQDWTQSFRHLAGLVEGGDAGQTAAIQAWLPKWRARLRPDAAQALRAANPAVIPRNHLVEAALTAATAGDMAPFDALLTAIRDPFGPTAGREGFTLPAPQGFGAYVTFCGT
jgi:uncharacterized protein YdiU (UPF0061 family)